MADLPYVQFELAVELPAQQCSLELAVDRTVLDCIKLCNTVTSNTVQQF